MYMERERKREREDRERGRTRWNGKSISAIVLASLSKGEKDGLSWREAGEREVLTPSSHLLCA